MPSRQPKRAERAWRAVASLIACAPWPVAAEAFSNVEIGRPIQNAELRTLDGGAQALLSSSALANVFVFVRPRQPHSLETLRQLARCEQEFAGKPVHFVAVVSSTWPPDDVKKLVAESSIRMPVLVDEGDALYGRLGVHLHPVIGIADEEFRLLAYEPFHELNYLDRVRARIRHALHEIDAAEVARIDAPVRPVGANDIEGAVAKRHLHMAEGYLEARLYDKATAEARRALELDPTLEAARQLVDEALARRGK